MDLELPKPNVTFDDDCNLRVLHPELRERSTHLADECKLLVSSKWKWMFSCSYKSSHSQTYPPPLPISLHTEVKEFQSLVASIDTEMNRLSNSKERKKLNATATRLKLEQNSNRGGEEKELLVSKIEAKKKEMEEFTSYIASLEEAERSQLAEIEKLEISSG